MTSHPTQPGHDNVNVTVPLPLDRFDSWDVPAEPDVAADPVVGGEAAGGGEPAGRGMTRRRFVVAGAGVGAAAAAGVVLAQHPWRHRPSSSAVASRALASGKGILVMVTLYGGNDGLNTVIPYTDGNYLGGRQTLGYQPNQVLPLAEGLALHPDLKGMKALWDNKQLAVVRGVGYPSPVLSHFRSMDIWQSGSPDTPLTTGILGRWLDATGTDPMRAISVGSTLPRLLTGEKSSGTAITGNGITLPGGRNLLPTLTLLDLPGPDRPGLAGRIAGSGADLIQVQHTLADLLSGAGASGTGGANHLETGPPPSETTTTAPKPAGKRAAAAGLAGALDAVARLIKAGSPTRVYQVSLGGFDNHAQEKDIHARLMTELDGAISGFMAALAGTAVGRSVVLMTYSEFGRRVAQNASGGTDHGTAAPLFVVGQAVRGGQFYGAEPSLTDLDNGNLKFTTDYRSVFTTMLARVIAVDPKVALAQPFPILDLV